MKTLVATVFLLLAAPALGHHSYSMFDGSRTVTVTGSVAKVEWANPHVFIWVYVPNAKAPNGYDLYAFSSGSTNVLARNGWSPTTLKVGENISVEYWPLRDGRTGGFFMKATHEDGRVTRGISGPNGVNDEKETKGAR